MSNNHQTHHQPHHQTIIKHIIKQSSNTSSNDVIKQSSNACQTIIKHKRMSNNHQTHHQNTCQPLGSLGSLLAQYCLAAHCLHQSRGLHVRCNPLRFNPYVKEAERDMRRKAAGLVSNILRWILENRPAANSLASWFSWVAAAHSRNPIVWRKGRPLSAFLKEHTLFQQFFLHVLPQSALDVMCIVDIQLLLKPSHMVGRFLAHALRSAHITHPFVVSWACCRPFVASWTSHVRLLRVGHHTYVCCELHVTYVIASCLCYAIQFYRVHLLFSYFLLCVHLLQETSLSCLLNAK